MYDYRPNPLIVDRAAELWRRALLSPAYDNGDESPRGGLAVALASGIPSNASEPGVIDRFCEALRERLKKRFDFVKGSDGNYTWQESRSGHFEGHLRVDYGPDAFLSECAKLAGLRMEFPWKTSMSLEVDHLSFRQGYGGACVYHYPLHEKFGRPAWLVTTLHGGDISKVIDLIAAGVETGLTIEEQPAAPAAGQEE